MDPNIPIIGVSTVLGALATYAIGRLTKGHDSRAAAEAALIGIGPSIIKEQNSRIQELQNNNDRLWQELRKINVEHQDCLSRLSRLENILKPTPGGLQ